MKKINSYCKVVLIALVAFFVEGVELFGQPNWTNADYQKALWMTTRFYGGQRSGNENWLLYNHLPSGVNAALRGLGHRADFNTTDNVDLSGGWNDCGDHVKFGQTQFYSAYMLIKGYTEFKAGYDDKYAYDYNGYKTSGQWNYEGSGHAPNCIPDVLDEMKHETDFLIKCTPNSSTFWYQVGNGGASGDHCERVTAVRMQTYPVNCGGNNDNGTPGARRPSCKNPNDGMMASLAAAALAVMAREYQPYDAAYAALCLTHAQHAYTYASTRLGSTAGTCFGSFYGAPAVVNATNAYVCAATELYTTTGTASYLTTANSLQATVDFNGGWSFDYANIGELALYCLAENGNATALTRFNNRITGHFLAAGSRNGAGVYTAHGTWGRLRYNGNAAFLISLYSKLNNTTTAAVINAIHNDVDYIMGKNSSNRTYIVGFAPATGTFTTPLYPHHRNAFLNDNNVPNTTNLPLPAKNAQMGALVGGQRDGTYNDSWNDYVNSEVCIDYNAGLVGALGFINARLAPISISCNTCRTPNIGSNLSTCSGSIFPLTLTDANTPGAVPANVSYTWSRIEPTPVTTPIGTAGASAKIRNIVASDCPSFPCRIVVTRDSAYTTPSPGTCTRRDTITITNNIATPTLLAGPLNICTTTFYDLTPSNAASFPGGTTWQWSVDYSGGTTYNNLTGETASTLANVRRAGRYRITATAGSCNSNSNVVITSNLPTPVDGCIASGPGIVPLAITNNVGTNYNWYTAPTGGSIIPGGTGAISVSSPSISTTTTYYVQDMSAVGVNVGPATDLGGGTNWGATNTGNRTLFSAPSNFVLRALKVPFTFYGAGSGSITIEIRDASNTVRATFVSDAATHPSSGVALQRFTFNGGAGVTIDVGTWGTNLKMNLNGDGTINGDPFWSNNIAVAYNYNSTPTAGVVTITGYEGGDGGGNDYMYFYDWEVQTGTPCNRLPVVARIGGCSAAPVELVTFTVDKIETRAILNWLTSSELNNDFFLVQRSLNGVDFETIGKVSGMGTTNSATTYSFSDDNMPSGLVYYRLVQQDYDGTATPSPIISIMNSSEIVLNVAPNPFNTGTSVTVYSEQKTSVLIKVMDLSGKVLEEVIAHTNQTTTVAQSVGAGVYLLQAYVDGTFKTVRIVKQ